MLRVRIERWDGRLDGALSENALRRKLKSFGYEPLPRPNPAGAIASASARKR